MRKFLTSVAVVAVCASAAYAANISLLTGPQEASQLQSILNTLIQQINTQTTPQAVASYGTPRNILDNGAMDVQQRGTGTVTCGQTSGIPVTGYGADRWGCDANVTSGAGQMAVITASPAPPANFNASMKLWRNSGALTQPVCVWQEITTRKSVPYAGQTVTLSFYAQALAGLSADNSNAINAYIYTGTGTDEGLGTLTASPAITPAWTGIAQAGTSAFTITTGWVRYQFSAPIPSTATEIGVAICFTPTATGAGATDGFAFTGVQLEQGSVASTYDYRPFIDELLTAQRYYYQISEPAAITNYLAPCQASTTTVVGCRLNLPVTMRATPATAVTTGTMAVTKADGTAASTCTITASAASNTAISVGLTGTCASSSFTAGFASFLGGVGGTGKVTVSADF